MNDTAFSLNLLKAIYEEAQRDTMTLAERGGLYASAKIVCDDFRDYADDYMSGHSYVKEKANGFLGHIGSVLGFDITNGHSKDRHLSWAFIELGSLRNTIQEHEGREGDEDEDDA